MEGSNNRHHVRRAPVWIPALIGLALLANLSAFAHSVERRFRKAPQVTVDGPTRIGAFDTWSGFIRSSGSDITSVAATVDRHEWDVRYDGPETGRIVLAPLNRWRLGRKDAGLHAVVEGEILPTRAPFAVGLKVDLSVADKNDPRTLSAYGCLTSRSDSASGTVARSPLDRGLLLRPRQPTRDPAWFEFTNAFGRSRNLEFAADLTFKEMIEGCSGAQMVFPDGYAVQIADGDPCTLTFKHGKEYLGPSGERVGRKREGALRVRIPEIAPEARHRLTVARTASELVVSLDGEAAGRCPVRMDEPVGGRFGLRSYGPAVVFHTVEVFPLD